MANFTSRMRTFRHEVLVPTTPMTQQILPTTQDSKCRWKTLLILVALEVLFHLPVLADMAIDPRLVKSLGLESFNTIRLVDEEGKSLSAEDFKKRIAARSTFTVAKNIETSTATLTISKASLKTIGLTEGSRMPPLKLTDTQGRVRTWDEFGDKPVVLNLFFAECPPCIQEVPALNAFTKSNPEIPVLSVTFENNAVTQKFIGRHGLLWPVAIDGRDFIDALGVKSYPTLLLVSPNRTLLAVKTGGIIHPENKSGYVFSLDVWVRQNQK
jgi:thiol-disulfide isomerase/thioredoxin